MLWFSQVFHYKDQMYFYVLSIISIRILGQFSLYELAFGVKLDSKFRINSISIHWNVQFWTCKGCESPTFDFLWMGVPLYIILSNSHFMSQLNTFCKCQSIHMSLRLLKLELACSKVTSANWQLIKIGQLPFLAIASSKHLLACVWLIE